MANQNYETISVVGLGYVGLPLALLADKKGYKVIGIDINENTVNYINKKESPFIDEHISQQIKNSNIKATSDFSDIKDSSIIIVCVPTPVHGNHLPNLKPVEDACKSIASCLKKGQLVVLESTVNPGVSEGVVLPILEKISGLKGGIDFYLAHCPERINPGDTKWNVENIPRVIGSLEKNGLKKAENFYRSIISGAIRLMGSLKEAEAVKIVENSFRDVNIAFVNELAVSFSRLGIDLVNVIEGAATKPFAFLAHFPGCGVGGHCIPVDPYYLIDYADKKGFSHDFLKLARRINDYMPEFAVLQMKLGLKEKGIALNMAKIAVLGLAYKPEIGDYRTSPSFEVLKYLQKSGANAVSFDPFVLGKSTAKTLDEAISGADAVVIATAHDCFKKLTPEYFLERKVGVVIDGRNCLPKEKFLEAGLVYKGIGR